MRGASAAVRPANLRIRRHGFTEAWMAWYAKHRTLVAAATATEARQDGSVRLLVDEVEASVERSERAQDDM